MPAFIGYTPPTIEASFSIGNTPTPGEIVMIHVNNDRNRIISTGGTHALVLVTAWIPSNSLKPDGQLQVRELRFPRSYTGERFLFLDNNAKERGYTRTLPAL